MTHALRPVAEEVYLWVLALGKESRNNYGLEIPKDIEIVDYYLSIPSYFSVYFKGNCVFHRIRYSQGEVEYYRFNYGFWVDTLQKLYAEREVRKEADRIARFADLEE